MPVRSGAAERVVDARGSLVRVAPQGGSAMKEWLVYFQTDKTVRVMADTCIKSENANWLIFANLQNEPVAVFDVQKIIGWISVKHANVNHVAS
jgi:hypothetical protein